jgi:hypothetical protein
MKAVLCIQVQVSSMVPSLGAVLVFDHASDQAALEAASSLITEKPKKGLHTSFPYQTTEDQNIPLEPSRIKIWANIPPNQNKWLAILPSQRNYLTCFSLRCPSDPRDTQRGEVARIGGGEMV